MNKKILIVLVFVISIFSTSNASLRVFGGYNMVDKLMSRYVNMDYKENSTGAMVYGIEYCGEFNLLNQVGIDSYVIGYKKTANRSIPNITWNGGTYAYTPVPAEVEFELYYLNLNHKFSDSIALYAGVNFPGFKGKQPVTATFSQKIGFQAGVDYSLSKQLMLSVMYEHVDLGRSFPNTSGNIDGYVISGIEVLLKYQF
jgi:opacity protein-like surface antigen